MRRLCPGGLLGAGAQTPQHSSPRHPPCWSSRSLRPPCSFPGLLPGQQTSGTQKKHTLRREQRNAAFNSPPVMEKQKSSRFVSPGAVRSLGGGGRGRGQGGIRPCHVTGEAHALPEPSRGWVPKRKVRIFLEHKNTRAALIILLGLSSRSTARVEVGWGVQGWARKDGRASLHSRFTEGRQGLEAGQDCLSLGPCPVLPALCSKSQGPGPQRERPELFSEHDASIWPFHRARLSLWLTTLLLWIVYAMSTSD